MPGSTNSEIRRHFGIEQDYCSDRLRDLEKAGYLRRSIRETNERRPVIWFVNEKQPDRHTSDDLPWSDEDKGWLLEFYWNSSTQEIFARFPYRTPNAVRRKASMLGLKRNPAMSEPVRLANARLGLQKIKALRKVGEPIIDAVQVLVPAPVRDDGIVVKAIQQRTALEMAWGGHV